MKILHTSDWHLGVSLKDHPRAYEHGRFLPWLTDTVVALDIDVVLVTGDVFDGPNPAGSSLKLWFGWLADLLQRAPGVQVIVIGGNHDSAVRLDAPGDLLRGLRIHTVGGLPLREDWSLDFDRLVLRVTDRAGSHAAWVGAVPFLRSSDFREPPGCPDVAGVYAAVRAALIERAGPNDALVLTGHLTTTGAALSDTEQPIVGGIQSVDSSLFGVECQYVALGHLHLPQGVSGAWYAGSPLPISFAERGYAHRVLVVTLPPTVAGRPVPAVESVPIPRAVDIDLWLDDEGQPLSLPAAERRIAALPDRRDDDATMPLVAIRLAPGGSASDRRALEDLCRPKDVRLLSVELTTDCSTPAVRKLKRLEDVRPEIVLEDAWLQAHKVPLPDEIRALFRVAEQAARAAAPSPGEAA